MKIIIFSLIFFSVNFIHASESKKQTQLKTNLSHILRGKIFAYHVEQLKTNNPNISFQEIHANIDEINKYMDLPLERIEQIIKRGSGYSHTFETKIRSAYQQQLKAIRAAGGTTLPRTNE